MVRIVAKYFMPLSILIAIIVIVVGVRFAIIKVSVDQVGPLQNAPFCPISVPAL